MAHNKKFEDYRVSTIAVAPIANTSGALTGVKINATDWDRATFHFVFGTPTGTASASAGLGIWQASTSGATYARVADASFGLITSGIGAGATHVIDINVDPSYPWLLVSGQLVNNFWPVACVAELSAPSKLPPTSLAYQIVSPD